MPEEKSATSRNGHAKNKKGKHRYLPHNKPVKKGLYPLRPGVEGFFITCDGGRERQATHEAINLLDTFYEELVEGGVSATKTTTLSKPLNKVIKFSDSDSSESGDESHASETEDPQTQNLSDRAEEKDKEVETTEKHSNETTVKEELHEDGEPPAKKQCREPCQPKSATAASGDAESLSIDKQIEAELKELGDRTKRHFVGLDSGCNGCIFIQMNKRVGDPGPAAIVHHMMKSAASTKKHMSRFILRVLPVEITCYASEEEITKAIEPLISQYFSAEAQTPQKFAVLYEARANTGIDRMKIINSVAKSVPQPHKVDLSNPDKTIIVQIAKTICMIGVVEGYKELAKYNLRQLTSK